MDVWLHIHFFYYFCKNGLLWKKLENGATEEELVATVLEEYDIDEETAKKDIKEFLEKLDQYNIIEK